MAGRPIGARLERVGVNCRWGRWMEILGPPIQAVPTANVSAFPRYAYALTHGAPAVSRLARLCVRCIGVVAGRRDYARLTRSLILLTCFRVSSAFHRFRSVSFSSPVSPGYLDTDFI